jgi:hypothetical protein
MGESDRDAQPVRGGEGVQRPQSWRDGPTKALEEDETKRSK